MKIGIALNNLGPSQLCYHLALQANTMVGSRSDVDVIAFYEDMQRPCLEMNFAHMQLAEGWGFDGVMVATSFSTAAKILRFPGPSRKLFYVWDLEWMRMGQKDFRSLQKVYGTNELTLVARSEDHARILSQVWNRDVGIITDNLDLNRFIESPRELELPLLPGRKGLPGGRVHEQAAVNP